MFRCGMELRYLSVCCITFVLGITSPGILYAQNVADGFIVQNWTALDGLPVNQITDLEQTADGYWWLTTYDGLVRFDGNRFVSYNKSNVSEIVSNRLFSIAGNGSNEFWIVTQPINGDQYHIHYKKGQFKKFGSKEGARGEIKSNVFREDGTYWFVDDFGVARIVKDSLERIYQQEIKPPIYTATFNDKELLVLNSDGIFNVVNDQITLILSVEKLDYTGVDVRLFRDKTGMIWYVRDGQFLKIRDGNVESVPVPVGNVPTYYPMPREDPSFPGRILLPLLEDKMLVYSLEEYKVLSSDDGFQVGEYLPGGKGKETGSFNTVKRLFYGGKLIYQVDYPNRILKSETAEDGSIWLATWEGLIRIQQNPFEAFTMPKDGIRNLYPIMEDSDGTVWSADLWSNIYKYEHNQWDVVFGDVGTRVFAISEIEKDEIWIGNSSGLMKFNKHDPKSLSNVDLPAEINTGWIRGLLKDQRGNIWVGAENGIFYRDKEEKWHGIRSTKDGESIESVRLFYERADGTIWFGNVGKGIGFIKEASAQFFEGNHLLPDNVIRSMYEDEDGILWVGTEAGGLSRVEMNKLGELVSVTNFNNENGLFDLVIHSILEDDFGRLWMSGNRGIFWVSRKELNAFAKGKVNQIYSTFYNQKDGLPGSEANGGMQSTGIKDQNGDFWFAMVEGVAKVSPVNFSPLVKEVPSLIEEFTFSDSVITDFSNPIKVPQGVRNIQIKYTAFNYEVNPQNILFRYTSGKSGNENWINAGARREAVFTDMKPGDYDFALQASLDGINWEETGSNMQFEIPPYFYETLTFRLLIVAAILMILYGLHRYRLMNIHKLEHVRLQIAHDLHDEIGSNLGSIVLRSNKLHREEGLREAARKNLSEIERISMETAQSMRDIIWVINPERGKMTDLVDKLNETSDTLLGNIEREFSADIQEGSLTISVETRRNLTLIAKEALHNIVKHSGATLVKISIKQSTHQLNLIVEDNGAGFKQDVVENNLLGTGIGSMKKRAQQIGADLIITSAAGEGTQLMLNIPLT